MLGYLFFLFSFFMTMIIFMFYNIYCLHTCFILCNLPIFVLHNIVFNVLSDNKDCCYKLLLDIEDEAWMMYHFGSVWPVLWRPKADAGATYYFKYVKVVTPVPLWCVNHTLPLLSRQLYLVTFNYSIQQT